MTPAMQTVHCFGTTLLLLAFRKADQGTATQAKYQYLNELCPSLGQQEKTEQFALAAYGFEISSEYECLFSTISRGEHPDRLMERQ